MSSFGLLETGFVKKTVDQILSEVEDQLRSDLGAGLNLQADSFLGQINGTYATLLAELWELAELVNASQNPDGATGAALDALLALTGLTRLPATSSSATLTVNLEGTTTLPAGTVFSTANGDRWITQEAVTNAGTEAADFTVQVLAELTGPAAAAAGTISIITTSVPGLNDLPASKTSTLSENYSFGGPLALEVRVDGGPVQTVLLSTEDTALDVSAAISTLAGVTATPTPLTTTIAAPGEPAGVGVLNVASTNGFPPTGTLTLELNQPNEEFISYTSITPTTFVLTGATSNPHAAGTAVQTSFVTISSDTASGFSSVQVGGDAATVLGFDAVVEYGRPANLLDADAGTNLETDAAARLRRNEALETAGAATLRAIRADVLAVDKVLDVIVNQNFTDFLSATGLLPHSVEVVILDDDTDPAVDDEIGAAIQGSIAAGIQTSLLNATVTADAPGDYTLVGGEILQLRVDGGPIQAFAMPGGTFTAAALAGILNGGFTGITASDAGGNTLEIMSNGPASIASVTVMGDNRDAANAMSLTNKYESFIENESGVIEPWLFARVGFLPISIDITVSASSDAYSGSNAEKIAAATASVQNNIVAEGAELLIGEDVLFERIKSAAFVDQGIKDVTSFLISVFPAPPGGPTNISVGLKEKADFDTSRITVTVNLI